MEIGKVTLVGAGPGNVELLTLGGRSAIENADVVVYDRLVGKDVLELIPSQAEKINVGKQSSNHLVPQQEINQILLAKALEGKHVVRLKGGDSFLFGRGGEELDLLQEHSVPFEVISGITSAIAAPAYVGIPVTHRDYCSSVHIITGHAKENGRLEIDFASLVRLNGTLVFLMSVSSLGDIVKGLISSGMAQEMPCAIIENGTLPAQRKFISTLGCIQNVAKEKGVHSPAVILVGKVCALGEKYDWFSELPLKGKRILVTRPKQSSNKLRDRLRALGADVTALPAIKTQPIEFVIPQLCNYSVVVFTSAVGVECFFEKLFSCGEDARALADLKVAVVGRDTANKLLQYGVKADFVPETYCGEALAEEMLAQGFIGETDKLLLFRGKIASQELNTVLATHCIAFDEVAVYDTVDSMTGNIKLEDYDLITFTSASCVNSVARHLINKEAVKQVTAVCIGKQTEAQAKAHGFHTVVSKKASIDSMIESIKEIYHD